MSTVARRVQSLSLEARLAVLHLQDVTERYGADPAFDRNADAKYSALLEPLIAVGGTWGDVKAILALHLEETRFANAWHARTVWVSRGGSIEGIAS